MRSASQPASQPLMMVTKERACSTANRPVSKLISETADAPRRPESSRASQLGQATTDRLYLSHLTDGHEACLAGLERHRGRAVCLDRGTKIVGAIISDGGLPNQCRMVKVVVKACERGRRVEERLPKTPLSSLSLATVVSSTVFPGTPLLAGIRR